ncbi:MAG: ATP-binding protein [Acidobacteriota bacterium]
MSHDVETSELQLIVYDRYREQGRYSLSGGRLVIGRRADADIRVNEPTMSGRHAEIVLDAGGALIRDLRSLNGTQLNGLRVDESPLQPGDEIQIGRARIVVSASPGTDTTQVSEPVDPQREETEHADALLLDELAGGGQTLKIKLDELRGQRAGSMREDPRILLLVQLFEALKSADDEEAVLRETRNLLQQSFRRARIFLLESRDDGSWWDPQQPNERGPSMTFVDETVSTESAILSTSLPDDRRFEAAESVRISGIETAMAAPVRVGGEARRVLYVDRLGLPPFHLPDLNLLAIAANHVSAVLENVSRFEILERMVDERTAEIRRQADEIRHLAEAKDELLGIAAHDIRGPLTVIQGTVELLRLRAGSVDPTTLEHSLELVHEAARGLSRLLSELLDAKSIESGKIRLERRPATAEELFAAALPVPRLAAEDKKIELITEVGDPSLKALADPRRLGQAIANLLLNAVKFSEPGSRIILRASRVGERLQIDVEDRGVGIPDDELEQIFGTFEQGRAGKEFGGSGLGLMIARRLVDLHEGELVVASEVGVGSQFSMLLPVVDPV